MHPDPQRLSQIPIFEGVPDEQLETIAAWFDVEEHPAGTRLTREGASGYAFFILDQGRARVEQDGAALGEIRPGEVFGELALVGDGRRTADVFADTEVRVLAMFGTRFRELQSLAPEVASRLDRIASERSGQLEGQSAAG
jgi:CRP-like cAMP-binding protein